MTEEAQNNKPEKKVEKFVYSNRSDIVKNLVNYDNVCKEAIRRETKLRQEWPKRYKYLEGDFFQEVLMAECRKAGLPVDSFARKPAKDPVERSPIPLKPSPSVPRTTSAMIGWRSSHVENNLEFTGPLYISPLRTLESCLGPNEFRVKNQKFIFLG